MVINEQASKDRVNFRLLVEQAGGLPLDFFTRTATELRAILTAIEKARFGEDSHAEWKVDTDQIQISASVNGLSAEELQDVVSDAYVAFEATSAGRREDVPDTVDDAAKRTVQRLVSRIQRVAPARVEAPSHPTLFIVPTKAIPSVARRREHHAAWSSIDGKLDVISVRRQPYFVIYEHSTNNRVRCTFPDDWLELVKNYLGYRILAEGYVSYRQDGTPIALTRPTALGRIAEPQQPDLTVYRGSLPGISGGLSSYEYVRRMREEDAG